MLSKENEINLRMIIVINGSYAIGLLTRKIQDFKGFENDLQFLFMFDFIHIDYYFKTN